MITVERLESTLNKTDDIINLVGRQNSTHHTHAAEEGAAE